MRPEPSESRLQREVNDIVRGDVRRSLRRGVLVAGVFACGGILLTATLPAAELSYNRDVRPILSDKCFACHGPDAHARQADLRLDRREEALSALSPDDPTISEVLSRVETSDADLVMPPPSTHKRLTAREKRVLRQWVESGAAYEPHWSFIPLRPVPVPAVESNWPRGDLDRFVLQRLQREKLKPSPEADRATLLRRVSLDLTGLPPTPEEVAAFVQDPLPDDAAYERVVDRLLASPRFGEHFAWHWLDAARYGDSDGYESDPMRNMWPWRDWVVEAFNRNLPYDRFIVEQLAGDLLPEATLRQKLASGFNRNHRLNNEGGIDPEEWLIEYVCDRAETTSTVFMGLTWGCARCHDHKFDPITQRDYYRLFAYFHNVPEIGNGRGDSNAEPMLSVSRLEDLEELAVVLEELRPLQAELEGVKSLPDFEPRFQEWLTALDDAALRSLPKELQETPRSKWTRPQTNQARQHYLTQVDAAGREVQQRLSPVQKRYDALIRTGAKVMVMGELPQPRVTHILNRGAFDQPGEVVSLGTPEWLPPLPVEAASNRLGLAEWLVSREHPLTSRVAVNRFWQLVFGQGLVRTPEDFGLQGEPPTHPELLDWLALRFMERGWDVKALVKELVLSSTYRQSSVASSELLARDPENRLLARASRFRLPAQTVRDQALYVSGRLVERVGGPPVKPYQPDGLWQDIIKGRPVYVRDKGEGLYRRSLYTLWRRAVKPPEMVLLDANERDTCTVNQRRTNTPLQALLLLNDVGFVEAARGVGVRMLAQPGDDATRIEFAVRTVLSRSVSEAEREILAEVLQSARERFSAAPEEARRFIAFGDSAPPREVNPVELAAHTAVARILLNVDEAITRQ